MIDITILLFLVVSGIAVILDKGLLSSIMIFTVYSLVMAIAWVRLNAVDVAITEASVGAGITTILFMVVLSKTKRKEKGTRRFSPAALLVTLTVAGILLYGTQDLPNLRDPNITPSVYLVPDYLKNAYQDTAAKNIVTAILASYRGYDTLGETAVVSTGGLCVILLLRQVTKEQGDKG